ncbi:MFS family permease [Catenuloplanes nepalensis]|uniref:MFS family permease n=1 Tax=Catenuloplanes nepalensis TaxID=587533 RepID=A0ABT9N5A3_9ACTN|nr:MFS transporter [Catenuloplanes nepalensis]MDP9798851.1 MFS family permease [Catenuloplanes nepalensis]
MSFVSGAGWRDVHLAAGARGVSVAGDLMAATTLALMLQSAGAGGFAVSGLMLAGVLPLVVLAPLTGRLVDRTDSRTLLVGVGLAQAAVCAALSFVTAPLLVVALVALIACGLALTQPTLAALLPAMVSREDLPRAMALSQTATSIGGLAAPVLAGVLVGQFGARVPLLLDAAAFLALAAAGLLIRTRRGRTGGNAATAVPGQPRFRYWRDPLLGAITVAIAGVVLGVGAINVVAIFYLRETLHASTTTYGLIEALWGVGLLAGTWVAVRLVRRMRDDGTLVYGTLCMLAATCLAIAAMAIFPAVLWVAPLYLIGGFFNGGLNVQQNVLVARRTPAESHGRAFAILVGWIQGANLTGYALAGFMLEVLDPRTLVFALGAAGVTVCALVAVPIVRAIHRERATARPALAAA